MQTNRVKINLFPNQNDLAGENHVFGPWVTEASDIFRQNNLILTNALFFIIPTKFHTSSLVTVLVRKQTNPLSLSNKRNSRGL